MSDIVVSKVNKSTMFIDCSNNITKELSRYFSAKAENYKFHPMVRAGRWDGTLYFLDYKTNNLPIGLKEKLKDFAKDRYSISFTFETCQDISLEDFLSFVKTLSIPFPPYDYQLKAAYDAIRLKHLNIMSMTGSGKSLIFYMIVRWLEAQNIRTLIIVPKIQLVEQLFGDFISYGWENVEEKCCRVYGGQKRTLTKNVIISTYQSLYSDAKRDEVSEDYIDFQSIQALMIDEAHGSKNKSLSYISKRCINAEYRCGCSGTYPEESSANWFTIVGGTGQIIQYSTYTELQANNQISNIKIKMIKLVYPDAIKRFNYENNKENYSAEVDYTNMQQGRMDFITKLVGSLEGNTLVLFIKKEKTGIPLFNQIKNTLSERSVFYIDGSVPVGERESIREQMEESDGVVLVGSFGVLSEGTNIKRVHNLIFASSYKSEIKVLQSLGRSLRLWNDKEYATLFDIVDDMKLIDKSNKIHYTNSTMSHGKKRYQIYKQQNFPIETIEYNIRG